MVRESRSDLRRRSGILQQRARIAVITEGQVTEPTYFLNLAKHLRATGVVVCAVRVEGTGRDPVWVVDAAKDKNEQAGPFDEVWCGFDVDDHCRLDEGIRLAKACGFKVAISNPCFEVWLVWHFEEWSRPTSTREMKRKATALGASDEGLRRRFPYSQYEQALGRGGACEVSKPKNPGSRVGDLVRVMRGDAP